MLNLLNITYTFALLLSLTCIFLVIVQKPRAEQQTALLISICGFITTMGYWSSIQAKDLSTILFAQKLVYVGGAYLYYLILIFILQYREINVSIWFHTICSIINTCFMLSVLTADKHQLFYKSYRYVIEQGVPCLVKEYGILHTLYFVVAIAYMLIILFTVLKIIALRRGAYANFNSVGLLLLAIIPTSTYVMEKLMDSSYSLVPIGMVIAELILVSLMYRFKLYDIKDTAREYTYFSIEHGLIVVDENYCYKGSNERARELFPSLEDATLDKPLSLIDYYLYQSVESHNTNDMIRNNRIYKPEIKSIISKNKLCGYVIWYYDVTAERERRRLLENYQMNLEEEVEKKTSKLRGIQEQMIWGFANIVENRDLITGGHIKRTSFYVNAILEGLAKKTLYSDILDHSYIEHMRLAAPLHDIGKVSVPDDILNKKGPLTDEEYNIMKQHTTVGAKIIEQNLSKLDDMGYYELARLMALYHHEKWNGKGYPEGLKEEEIPLCARIMAIADVFDALVSERPYKQAYSIEKAYEIIENERGVSFDPIITDCFLEVRPKVETVLKDLSNGEQKSNLSINKN